MDLPQIVFEDDWLLAVNKPSGLMVHANPESNEPQDPNLQDLMSEGRKRRLILFHRLDKDTSGVVLLGKRPEIGETMSKIFEEKRIRKAYYAIVSGVWSPSINRVECRLARGERGRMMISDEGKPSLTTFRICAKHPEKTWLEAMPKTGRTHQIRVHCASQGHAILGDKLYGEPSENGLALHAHRVDFAHPVTKNNLRIEAPVPTAWSTTWLKGFNK